MSASTTLARAAANAFMAVHGQRLTLRTQQGTFIGVRGAIAPDETVALPDQQFTDRRQRARLYMLDSAPALDIGDTVEDESGSIWAVSAMQTDRWHGLISYSIVAAGRLAS